MGTFPLPLSQQFQGHVYVTGTTDVIRHVIRAYAAPISQKIKQTLSKASSSLDTAIYQASADTLMGSLVCSCPQNLPELD